MQRYPSFHDWFLVGIAVEAQTQTVVVVLRSDNKMEQAQLLFEGASRCLANGFAAQNVVYELKILDDVDSAEYRSAVSALEEAHPWGSDWPHKKIASFASSVGAELLVEYLTLTVTQEALPLA
jgi:predicted TIM-barrel fold metal-dependent hydrolase